MRRVIHDTIADVSFADGRIIGLLPAGKNMSMVWVFFCLLFILCGGTRADDGRASPAEAAFTSNLWDMAKLRRRPLDVRPIVEPRKAPLLVRGSEDWMNTGDAWVAKKQKTGGAKSDPPSATAGDEQLIVEEFFLTAGGNDAGPNRIYCGSARPESATGPVPTILVFHGGGGHASGALAIAIARRHPGMAAVAMDYNGQFRPGREGRVTAWKTVTAEMRQRQFDLVPGLTNWSMWHNVMAARRTIDFIEMQSWANADRIGAVGISYGGWLALILAGVDDRVKCVTTGVSAGGASFTAGRAAQQLRWEPAEQRQLWLDHYEPLAHAPNTKAAVFFQLATNDLFFWLNGAEKNLAAFTGEKGWVLRPNSNHGAGGPEVPNTAAPALVRHILADGPALPQVTAFRASDDGCRYAWKATGPHSIHRATLNWSPGGAVSPARYWIEFPATCEGDTWSAEIPVDLAGCCSQSFVNVGDNEGTVVSSTLLHHNGLDPMTEPGPQWSGGQLWDTERGAAAWRTPAGWFPSTEFEVTADNGLKVSPAEGGEEFILLTNSAILASGAAKNHPGIRVHIDGQGQAGRLKVTLLRDTNSLDESAWTAEIDFAADSSECDLPWNEFSLITPGIEASAIPAGFDGLSLSGERKNGSAVVLESIQWITP